MLPTTWTVFRRVADHTGLREGPWVEYRIRIGHGRRNKGIVFTVSYSPDERRLARTRELGELLELPCAAEILAMVEALHS